MLVVLFVTTVVSNVWGVLTIGVPEITLAVKRAVNKRDGLPSARFVSIPPELYMIELSLISLFVSVGAVLAIV